MMMWELRKLIAISMHRPSQSVNSPSRSGTERRSDLARHRLDPIVGGPLRQARSRSRHTCSAGGHVSLSFEQTVTRRDKSEWMQILRHLCFVCSFGLQVEIAVGVRSSDSSLLPSRQSHSGAKTTNPEFMAEAPDPGRTKGPRKPSTRCFVARGSYPKTIGTAMHRHAMHGLLSKVLREHRRTRTGALSGQIHISGTTLRTLRQTST